MKTTFLLARHGETEWNQVRRLQGRLNSPLTANGVAQAKQLALQLETANIDAILTSPLGRARQTAEICQQSLGAELIENEHLKERHFGQWESRFFDELTAQAFFTEIFQRVDHHAPPDGETGMDCSNRIRNALASIARDFKARTVLVITHGDAIRCFFASLQLATQCDAYSQYGNGKTFEVVYCHSTKTFQGRLND